MSPDENEKVLDKDKESKLPDPVVEKKVAEKVAKEEATPVPVEKKKEKAPPKEKKETPKENIITPSEIHSCPDCNRKYQRTHVCRQTGLKYENGKVKTQTTKERTPISKEETNNSASR